MKQCAVVNGAGLSCLPAVQMLRSNHKLIFTCVTLIIAEFNFKTDCCHSRPIFEFEEPQESLKKLFLSSGAFRNVLPRKFAQRQIFLDFYYFLFIFCLSKCQIIQEKICKI